MSSRCRPSSASSTRTGVGASGPVGAPGAPGPTGPVGEQGGTGTLPIPISAGSVLFRPGIASNPPLHVETWAEVETAIAAVQGVIEVLVDDDLAPAIIPATADTEMFGRVILSTPDLIPGATLQIADGGRIRNPSVIQGGLIVSGAPTAVIPIVFSTPGVVMRQGGVVRNDVGALVAMIDVLAPNPNFILAMIEGSSFDNSAVPAVPIVNLSPGVGLAWVVLQAVTTPITPSTIQGDATTSFTYLHDASSEAIPQILFLGTFFEQRLDRAAAILPSQGPTVSRPIIVDPAFVGQMFFDTTLGFPVWWNGVVWVDATGTSA